MKSERPQVSPYREAWSSPPESLKNSPLAGKEDICLRIMQDAKIRETRMAKQGVFYNVIFDASHEDIERWKKTFFDLYKSDPEVKAYFDALYPIRLAQAKAKYEVESRKLRGFETEEAEQASWKREQFDAASRTIISGIQILVEMGIPKETIEKICREAIEKP